MVSGKAVDREQHLAGDDLVALAIGGFDVDADHGTLSVRHQRLSAIADSQWNAALLDGGQQVVDQILTATGYRRMKTRDRVADMLIGRHQFDTCANRIDQPLDRFRRGRNQPAEQIGAVGRAARAQQVCRELIG